MVIKDLIDTNFNNLKNSLENNKLVDEITIKEVHQKGKLQNITNLPIQRNNKILEKVESINDRLIYTSKHDIVNDYNTFVEETNWATSEISKVSSVINYFDKSRVFSSSYLKDLYKLESSKYFKFVKEYLKPEELNNNPTFTNRNFLNERTSIKLDKSFHSILKRTSNFLNETLILTGSINAISNTSFITQNLINLNHNNKFFYPNTFFRNNEFSSLLSDVQLSDRITRVIDTNRMYTFNDLSTVITHIDLIKSRLNNFIDVNKEDLETSFTKSISFSQKEFLPVRTKYLDIETINSDTFYIDSEFKTINIEKLENDKSNWKQNGLNNIEDTYTILSERNYKNYDNVGHIKVRLNILDSDSKEYEDEYIK